MPAPDVTIVFHGSSLTGQSFKAKGGGSRLFDVDRDSDFDLAIVSETLFKRATQLGVKIRGDHSEPLSRDQMAALGLADAHEVAVFHARREVNFMLYQSESDAHQHEGPALVAKKSDDYTHISGQLHGDVL
jgi:predicted nucleotidyltransferase